MAMQEQTLDGKLRFFQGFLSNPRAVSSIAPSSPALAARIAQEVPQDAKSVVELGPGTGVITQALIARGIAPERISTIEYDPGFAAHMRRHFPQVTTLRGDAFAFDRLLGLAPGRLSALVCGLPLLNFPPPKRAALIDTGLDMLEPGAPFIQLSHGWTPPVESLPHRRLDQKIWVFRNFPPARVWVYRR